MLFKILFYAWDRWLTRNIAAYRDDELQTNRTEEVPTLPTSNEWWTCSDSNCGCYAIQPNMSFVPKKKPTRYAFDYDSTKEIEGLEEVWKQPFPKTSVKRKKGAKAVKKGKQSKKIN